MTTTPLAVGDRIPLRLDSLAVGGEAVGRHQGRAVFVVAGCPGDEALVEITEVLERFARGRVAEIITPSPDRVAPPCGLAEECGGCQLQHIAYPAQLAHKTQMIRDAVTRLGGLEGVEIRATWGMDDPWHYRTRAEYHAQLTASGDLLLGFLRRHSHDVIPMDTCRLQHPLSEQVRATVVELMGRLAQSPTERAQLFRLDSFVSLARNQALPTLICEGVPPFLTGIAEELMARLPEVVGVAAARSRGRTTMHRSPSGSVRGKSRLVEALGEYEYHVSADSFFQVNPAQATRMLALVEEWAQMGKHDSVIDAYCGVGTFLLPLAKGGGPALGIEAEDAALADARLNAKVWHLRNADIERGKVERVLPGMVREGAHCDVVVLDPPRKGAGPIVVTAATRLRPKRIVLISCHPATLARDLKTLAEHGYVPRRIQPIDMFPHTWHVEAVALCEPKG